MEQLTAAHIILLAWLFLDVVVIVLGYFLCSYAVGIRRQSLEEARAWQEAHYDISWYDPLEKTDCSVRSYDGYRLNVQALKNPVPTDKYVIISHGYTDNRFGSLKYTKMYLDLGFNVILYDLRGHGMNEKTNLCTYTLRERWDLNSLIQDTRERFENMTQLGLHGESLGAATSVAVTELKPRVDFIVEDCGFAEIIPVMRGGLRGLHLPACLVHVASVWCKIRYGFFFREMRPVDCLDENKIPILFIHGAEDTFIHPSHCEGLYKANPAYGEMHLIPNAPHAASILTDPEAYKNYVSSFLNKIETA